MPKPSPLPPWPQYPNIPIYLDPPDEQRTPQSYGTSEQSFATPEINVSGRSPLFFRVGLSPHTPNHSLRLPSIESLRQPSPQQHRRPPLRYFLDQREPRERNSRRQSRRSVRRQFHTEELRSPRRPHDNISYYGHSPRLGLGISGSSIETNLASISSSTTEKDEPNLVQSLEKRIWRYNTSGNVVKRWLFEILSWTLSTLCMGAIIGILIYLKDERLPKWPLGLTLNAYISLLSKIASAALLFPTSEALGQLKWSWFQSNSKKMWDFEIFDNASRGPWGSILLLIRTKGGSLAALGALITLFSLALEPFFQQVIDFPERWVCEGWNSTIPTVTRYEPPPSRLFINGQRRVEQDDDADDIIDRFFFGNGTQPVPFGNGTRTEIPLSCPTSNCTWPVYDTLGVCSSCEDISEMLTFACLEARVDWVTNLTGFGTESTYPIGTSCGHWLNSTSELPTLMSGYLVESVNTSIGVARKGETLLMRTLPLLNPSKPLFGGSIKFNQIRNRFVDVVISGSMDQAAVFRNETPVAQECVLSWCVKTMKSSYYWANYKEEVTSTFVNATPGPYPFIISSRGSQNTFVVNYFENVTIQPPFAEEGAPTYGVSSETALGFVRAFSTIFPSLTTTGMGFPTRSLLRLPQYEEQRVRDLEFNPWLPPNNVTLHMERLAIAWTNSIRSSTSRSMISGMAFNRENYVAVRWIWLTLPLSLLFLTFVFLAATVMKASWESERVGIWKTSAIATLLYGLPDDMQKKITMSASTGTPRAKAKDLQVKMLSKGWRVSGSLFSPTTPRPKISKPPPGWI